MELSFETPPSVSLARVFLKRGRGVEIPRIEASARSLPGDAAAYAAICGFASASPLPITWPNVLTAGLQRAVLTSAAFPLRLLGIVHTRQVITRKRHISPDEALSGSAWVEGFRPARSGGEFDLTVVVRAGEEEVWRILSRDLPGHGERRASPEEPAFKRTRSVRWRLPADLGRRYAAVSGDYNPIHWSWITARPFGFSRAIAHGWWTLARALAELDGDLPEAVTVSARFRAPVPLPSTVTFESGTFESGSGERGHRFVLLRGQPCLTGEVLGLG